MSIIVWTPALSVGIAQFDAEHQSLIGMFNDLFTSIGDGGSPEQLGELIEGIVNYTNGHFAHEEFHLTKYGYPQLEQHKAHHRRLSDEAAAIQSRYAAAPDSVPIMDVFMFFRTGLIRHFYNVDPLYTKFLQAHGVS